MSLKLIYVFLGQKLFYKIVSLNLKKERWKGIKEPSNVYLFHQIPKLQRISLIDFYVHFISGSQPECRVFHVKTKLKLKIKF